MQSVIDRIIYGGIPSKSFDPSYDDDSYDEGEIYDPEAPPNDVDSRNNVQQAEYDPLQPLIHGLDGADTDPRSLSVPPIRTTPSLDSRTSAQRRQEELRAKLLAKKNASRAVQSRENIAAAKSITNSSFDLDQLVEEGKAAAVAAASPIADASRNSLDAIPPKRDAGFPMASPKELLEYEKIQLISKRLQSESQSSSAKQLHSLEHVVAEVKDKPNQDFEARPAQQQAQITDGVRTRPAVVIPELKCAESSNDIQDEITATPSSHILTKHSQMQQRHNADALKNVETLRTEHMTERKRVLQNQVAHEESEIPTRSLLANGHQSDYFHDVDEWLEATGYHDESYRKRALHRHRTIKHLKQQQAELEREALLESQGGTYVYRIQSQQPIPMEDIKHNLKPMAPPRMPSNLKEPLQSSLGETNGESTFTQSHSSTRPHSSLSNGTTKISRTDEAKRDSKWHRDLEDTQDVRGRTESSQNPYASSHRRVGRSASPVPVSREVLLQSNRNGREAPIRRTPPPISLRYRDREDERYRHSSAPSIESYRPSSDVHKGGMRYFLIKSWNHDNVEEAQYEGVWATQAENAETFTEAFKTCRHVLLIFSVNKSKAFQGFARMESLPGTAPNPRWVSRLNWQASPAFHIRWISKSETHFRAVGHLKNSMNEDLSVIVGRDGQEIEPKAGAELVKLLDWK